jgi:protein phosphatase methylesterase 1
METKDEEADEGTRKESFPSFPQNPAVRALAGESGGGGAGKPPVNSSRNLGLLRKPSFGVPQIKNHKELVKDILRKKFADGAGNLGALNEQEAFHTSSSSAKDGSAFAGSNVPSMKSFEPLSWRDYFDEKKQVRIEDTGMTFNLYTAGLNDTPGGGDRPLLYCIHGGGYTGLSWALLAKNLKHKYGIAALDLRSHGESDPSESFAMEDMTKDVTSVWHKCFGESKPKTVLLGHSLGGAVAICSSSLLEEGIPSLAATIVIDVVEGTAMQSLPYMQQVIGKRPQTFSSIENFVKYAYTSGLTKNFEAARVSAASQVKPDSSNPPSYVWITDLMKTEPFWKGWYQGMSAKFLKIPVPKLLLLAGTDRLDKDLTIGQMQGKFQMKVLPAGHAIHEDEPQKTCEAVDEFIQRFKI